MQLCKITHTGKYPSKQHIYIYGEVDQAAFD